MTKEKVNSKKVFIIFILLIAFFKPDCITSFYKVNYLYTLLTLSVYIFLLIIYISRNKVNKFDLFVLGYYGCLLLSTIINNGNVLKVISDASLNLGMLLIVDIFFKKDKIELFKALTIIFYTMMIFNTLSFILIPDGITKTEYLKTPIYFLGIDNRFAFTYIPGLCIIMIYDYLLNKKITKISYIFFLLTYITFLYFWSAGALLAETLFIFFYVIIYKMKKYNFTNKYFLIIIVSFISLVILRMQNLFEYLIVNILHKDLTLSSRTEIWDATIRIINNNKFLGIGVQKSNFMIRNISAFHAHSYFLNIVLQCGICGFTIYIIILYNVFKKLNKFKSEFIAQIISFTIFVMFVMLLIDTFDITGNLFLILAMGYNVKDIVIEEL